MSYKGWIDLSPWLHKASQNKKDKLSLTSLKHEVMSQLLKQIRLLATSLSNLPDEESSISLSLELVVHILSQWMRTQHITKLKILTLNLSKKKDITYLICSLSHDNNLFLFRNVWTFNFCPLIWVFFRDWQTVFVTEKAYLHVYESIVLAYKSCKFDLPPS